MADFLNGTEIEEAVLPRIFLECWFIFKEELATLNRRQEIFSTCRHKARLTLSPKEVVDD